MWLPMYTIRRGFKFGVNSLEERRTPAKLSGMHVALLCKNDWGRWMCKCGAVAQLGERLVRNEEVSGSIPLSSTNQVT